MNNIEKAAREYAESKRLHLHFDPQSDEDLLEVGFIAGELEETWQAWRAALEYERKSEGHSWPVVFGCIFSAFIGFLVTFLMIRFIAKG